VRRLRGRERSRGQALVEFALVLPVFVMLILGLLDFGRVMYIQHTLAEAAREATRVGIASPATSSAKYTAMRNQALSYAPGAGITSASIVGLNCNDCFYPDGTDSGDRVVVIINTNVSLMTPILSQFMKGTYAVQGRSTGFIP
jgi:Flp pilus assembly protein TadG